MTELNIKLYLALNLNMNLQATVTQGQNSIKHSWIKLVNVQRVLYCVYVYVQHERKIV